MNNPIKNSIKLLTIGASVSMLAACSSDSDYDFAGSELRQQQAASAPIGAFDPANRILPLPNDLLFSGTTDLTLNIPVEDPDDFSNPRVALNTLDGWSTSEPIVADFSVRFADDYGIANSEAESEVHLLNAESVAIQDSVRMFEVERGSSFEVTNIIAELDATQILAMAVPTDPTTSANGSKIALIPLQPLKENTTYMVLVTNGVTDVNNSPLGRGVVFNAMAGTTDLEGDAGGLQLLIRAMLGYGEAAGVSQDSVVLSWTFSTQSISSVLQTLKENAISSPIGLVDTQVDTGALSASSPDLADIFAGQMSVPYYLDIPSEAAPTATLSTFFKNASGGHLTPLDNAPVVKNTATIPVLMTKPKTEVPEGGFPVAIFQHGITRSRVDMLAIADAMASAGFATIAIDSPLHGISPDNATYASFRMEGIERTFDVDLENNTTRELVSDGIVDASGSHFYNLRNLLNTRDNNRQAIADLFTLSASVGTIADINPARKVFIGHSLGAITGTTFLAFDDTIDTATLAVGGGGLPRILANSPSIGPAIEAGLAAAGIDINSAEGNAFLNAAQTIVDSVDPINHAAKAGENTTVHMVQVNNDTVVINNLTGFPLVGTEPLARTMGLTQVSESTTGSGFVKFSTGYHGSLLNPADSNPDDDIDAAQAAAVFTEMQTQVVTFAAGGGIAIGDTSVIDGAVAP